MRRLATCAAVGALLVGAADGAWGQEMGGRRASRFDVGIYAGGSLTSDWLSSRTVTLNGTDTPTENDDEEGYAPGFAPAFGALANLWITPALGVRLHGAYVPMRLPNTESAFTDAGEKSRYVMNTWFYDLGLTLRPFATRDVSRWMSSMYLFAGGGGVTTDLAGEDVPLCEGTVLGLGGCLSFDPAQATVGQGTAGVGFDLVPLGPLALFAEAAVHVYDSPVHVDDAWVGPITAPTRSTVRIADDAAAVTGRLVLGLKMAFGNLIPAPVLPPPPPALPPVVPPPPPPPPPGHFDAVPDLRVCVVENGMLREVTAQYNTRSGDTTVNGQPFSALPTTGYAAGATWYINNEPIRVNGRRYVRYGLPRVLGVSELMRSAEYQGVPVFAEAGAQGTPEVLYVPVRPGCEFQPYQLEVKAGGVRGE
jgi:hypothetical protein